MKKEAMTIGILLGKIKKELRGSYPKEELDHLTYIVFEYFLGISKTDLVLKCDQAVALVKLEDINDAVRRLKNYEPIHHIINTSFFMGIQLKSDTRALIPRQETEELVLWIIEDHQGKQGLRIADIGSGSGCISILLARELANSRVSAVDISKDALGLARENADLHEIEIELYQANILDWRKDKVLGSMEQQFDVIVSNPPYIQRCDTGSMSKNVLDYEPEEALFVETDEPLIFYNAIANWSCQALIPGGSLYLEVNERFGKNVKTLLLERGFTDVVLKRDIHDKDRMVRCKWDPVKS